MRATSSLTVLCGETDPPEWTTLLRAEQGDVAFDVGANGGYVSRLLAQSFKVVMAFEPCLESFDHIPATDRIIPYPLAISDTDGEIELREAARSIRTGQLVTGESLPWGATVGVRTVPSYRLDTFCDEIDTWPDLVKVDVEGHEVQVLQGAPRLIARGCTWMIEVHGSQYLRPLTSLLAGYTLQQVAHTGYRVGDPTRFEHFYLRAVPHGDGE